MDSYGTLLEDIDIERIGVNQAVIAVMIRILRIMWFVAGVMLFIKRPIFCIFSFNFNITFYMVYLQMFNPLNDKVALSANLRDEFFLLLCNYHLFCFTKWLDIPT